MPDRAGTLTQAAFEERFLRIRPQLVSFLFRITTNRQDAEDLALDTYLKALDKRAGFAGKSSLKTWIFAIATNLARDHFRVRHRWREDAQDRCRTATQASPEKVATMREIVACSPVNRYEFKEHIDYCFTCLAKTLAIEQQLVLILKDVYGFRVSEIMEILQLTEGKVKHALAQGRRTMIDIFDRRCVLVSKQGVCYQCSEINGFVNPRQAEQEAAVRSTLVQEADAGASKEHLFALRTALIRGIDPLHAPGAALHAYLLKLVGDTEDG